MIQALNLTKASNNEAVVSNFNFIIEKTILPPSEENLEKEKRRV
jgi:hypothetical protein